MSSLIYSANFGDYDELLALPGNLKGGFKALYFTEASSSVPQGWERADLLAPAWWLDLPNPARAKAVKINPWLWLGDDWDTSIWIDGNINIVWPLDKLKKKLKGEFVTLSQSATDSFYKEFGLILKHKRPYLVDLRGRIQERIDWHKEQGHPDKDRIGGICTRFILRRNTAECKKMCEAWLEGFLEDRIWRDQVALRYAGQDLECKVAKRSRKECGISYSCRHKGNRKCSSQR